MKTFNDIAQQLDEQGSDIKWLTNQHFLLDERDHKDNRFICIILILIIIILGGFTTNFAIRLSQAEKNIQAMGEDLIKTKNTNWLNSHDIDQMVCELRDQGYLDKGWTCELYDEYE